MFSAQECIDPDGSFPQMGQQDNQPLIGYIHANLSMKIAWRKTIYQRGNRVLPVNDLRNN